MRRFSFLALFLMIAFVGCDQKISHEPVATKYDRDICDRCRMIISDRQHTVQIINPKDGKRYHFDDIGCAVLWFSDKNLDWFDSAKIFVTDYDTGVWIDARTAFWSTERVTSMGFGVVAHQNRESINLSENPHRKIVDFDEVIKIARERGK